MLVGLNYGTPTFACSRRVVWNVALESAMDELAYVLNIDPVTLRLTNHTDIDPDTGKPWSSKYSECYRQAAEQFAGTNATEHRAQ